MDLDSIAYYAKKYGAPIEESIEIDESLLKYISVDWYMLLYRRLNWKNEYDRAYMEEHSRDLTYGQYTPGWVLLTRFNSDVYEHWADVELTLSDYVHKYASYEHSKTGKIEQWQSGEYKLLPKHDVPGRKRKKKLASEDLIFYIDNGMSIDDHNVRLVEALKIVKLAKQYQVF